MVFSSIIFLFLFLPALLIIYFIASKLDNIKINNMILLLFSLLFIFWGTGKDIIVLFEMILLNYFCGLLIYKSKNNSYKKIAVYTAVILSLAMLFYYKYALFFAENISIVFLKSNINWSVPDSIKHIVLPLGISFYTFQALSYTIDVYKGNCKATKSLLDFTLYVSLFPQLIAGPIVRYKDIYYQINNRNSSFDRLYSGLVRFIMGFCKKVLLANTVAYAADIVFEMDLSNINTPLAWIGIIAYTLQIYLDFSAYSDMAIGLGRIFGFDYLENFNFPYIAVSVQDFWKRWHISLSSWLRDYLYIPLGGNRKGIFKTYRNLIVVFILCGLWHGANWTFVCWGIWHGMFLILERTKAGKLINKAPNALRRIYVLLEVMIGWVIFRSNNIAFALSYVKKLFIPENQNYVTQIMPAELCQNDFLLAVLFGMLSSVGLFVFLKNKANNSKPIYRIAFQLCLLIVFIMAIAQLYVGGYNPFIYFRF